MGCMNSFNELHIQSLFTAFTLQFALLEIFIFCVGSMGVWVENASVMIRADCIVECTMVEIPERKCEFAVI